MIAYKPRGGFGISETGDIAGTLESEGGSHQGGPERTPLVAAPLGAGKHGQRHDLDNDLDNDTYIAFDRTRGTASGEVAAPQALSGAATEGVNDAKADAQCVAFAPGNLMRRAGENPNTEVVGTLGAEKQGDMFPHVALWHNHQMDGSIRVQDNGTAPTVSKHWGTGGNNVPMWGVRRLTPTECERLQAFPDGWTEGEGQSDSTRYRQLGNAVCISVVEWIGRRIVAVESGEL